MKLPIYLDYAATTPVDPRVAQKMIPFLSEHFGNPASSSHAFGWTAQKAVEEARAEVAALLKAEPQEIVWTSGATEGNNLAIKGAALHHQSRGRHLITVSTEHLSVLDSVRELQRQGFSATVLAPGTDGLISVEQLRAAMRPDTVLVSVMMVNNEIGVIQPIAEIGTLCREKGIIFHCDAVQAAGKLEIDTTRLPVDLLTVTAHKVYGPKGIGALYVRRKPPLQINAQIHGGGHEHGLRSGTLATHQIVGIGEAFRIARLEMAADNERIRVLRDRLWDGLRDLGGVVVNGDMARRIAHNLNVSLEGVDGESLMLALKEIAVSAGSACISKSGEPSYVLRAIGRSDELAHNAIRFTVGKYTSREEIDFTVELLRREIAQLRERSLAAAG